MEKLIKVTEKERKLSGYEKTAILLGELGPQNSDRILKILNLSTKELKKINSVLKKLNRQPVNNAQIKHNEVAVLSEAVRYGKQKGIIYPVEKDHSQGFRKMADNNPQAIANILSSWIGDKQ